MVLLVLAASEDPDPECAARHPGAESWDALQARKQRMWADEMSAISTLCKKGGQKLRSRTLQQAIDKADPTLLSKLKAHDLAYAVFQAVLRRKKLPVSSERQLRRMIRSKPANNPGG